MKQPIFTGTWGNCHIQGIAIDQKKGYLYCSFTTKLIKCTLDGQVVGTADGLLGHLGCIAFNEEDGRIYGSLDYKNDSIGNGIKNALGSDAALEDAFYVAIFDVDKITRMDMDVERDGIMTAVYLKEVVDDYNGTGHNRQGEAVPHRYGCSGIDGITFGPLCGEAADSKRYLYICYGVYGDVNRDDNDHQVMLCYDTANWAQYEKSLSQLSMHRQGPTEPFAKYFVFTGNTTYGVQNLEYDPYKRAFFMAVYTGRKQELPNYPLFAVDASIAPRTEKLAGLSEEGAVLTLMDAGRKHAVTGLRGWTFPLGSTGLYAWGNGRYTISNNMCAQSGQCALLMQYVWDDARAFVLED